MKITEGRLTFQFDERWDVVKFDDEAFFREYFGSLPGGKGVDFVTVSHNSIQLIEVKDCLGYEDKNRWRLNIDHSRRGRDTFDIEIAKKVAMSLSCLYGAFSQEPFHPTAERLAGFYPPLIDDMLRQKQKRLRIILFLEGNFATHAFSEKMILQKVQRGLTTRLRWLNCQVVVANSNTVKPGYFKVDRHS